LTDFFQTFNEFLHRLDELWEVWRKDVAEGIREHEDMLAMHSAEQSKMRRGDVHLLDRPELRKLEADFWKFGANEENRRG